MNKRSAEESKNKILEAASTVFAEHGYAEASMRAIARQAGISVGGLYLYFRNKEELYLTFMQDWMKKLNDRTSDALLGLDNPVEALEVFIRIALDFAVNNREIIALQGRELGFPFGSEIKKNFSLERRNWIASIIRKGIANGVFRDGTADEAAKVIFNLLRGFVVSMVINEESLFTTDECVKLVLHGLLRRNSG
jgi:AcrR family transcriptional regulator